MSSSRNYDSSPGSASLSSSSRDSKDSPSPPSRQRKRSHPSIVQGPNSSGRNAGDGNGRGAQTTTKMQRRGTTRQPPTRLSWPGAGPSFSMSQKQDQHSPSAANATFKKSTLSFPPSISTQNDLQQHRRSSDPPCAKRKASHPDDDGNANDSRQYELWVDKYRPRSIPDLAVAPKKLKEIQSWIDGDNGQCHHMRKKLLILVGSPGVGKSTAVQVLAETECNKQVVSWIESIQPRTTSEAMLSSRRQLFSLEQKSSLDSFEEFLMESGSGISALTLATTSTTTAYNASIDNNVCGSKGNFAKHKQGTNKGQFKHHSFSRSANLETMTKTAIPSGGSLILLEDLPNLHGYDMESRFRSIMTRHLHRSKVPTVLIYSDVAEGKHRPEDLERLIDPDILYDQNVTTICQIHHVTKPRMKKILGAIAKAENCHGRFGPDYFEHLHEQGHGDIRHAIMTFQMDAIGSSNRTVLLSSVLGSTSHSKSTNERDTKLSTFHSLGKLLYAKKTIVEGKKDDFSRPSSSSLRLAFDPDTIIERSDFGVDGSLRFLEGHAIDFFTDITDISDAYKYFSDASALWNSYDGGSSARGGSNSRRDGCDQIFPFGCAAAVAGRAVAITNRHPSPNKFRQFSAPVAFDVLRKRAQNQVIVDQLTRRISSSFSTSSSGFSSLNDRSKFVTESLPFLRKIAPDLVDPSVTNLYSMARANHYDRKQIIRELSQQYYDEEERILKDQEEILGVDDIEDYQSD